MPGSVWVLFDELVVLGTADSLDACVDLIENTIYNQGEIPGQTKIIIRYSDVAAFKCKLAGGGLRLFRAEKHRLTTA